MSENKKEIKKVAKPTLKVKESNHYSSLWFDKSEVELRTRKNGNEFYIVTIEGNEIMLGVKALIQDSKDGKKTGFHIQNSREYRIFGTSQMVTGKELVQYIIALNTFNKQQSETK